MHARTARLGAPFPGDTRPHIATPEGAPPVTTEQPIAAAEAAACADAKIAHHRIIERDAAAIECVDQTQAIAIRLAGRASRPAPLTIALCEYGLNVLAELVCVVSWGILRIVPAVNGVPGCRPLACARM